MPDAMDVETAESAHNGADQRPNPLDVPLTAARAAALKPMPRQRLLRDQLASTNPSQGGSTLASDAALQQALQDLKADDPTPAVVAPAPEVAVEPVVVAAPVADAAASVDPPRPAGPMSTIGGVPMSAAEIFAMLPDSEEMNTPASLPSITIASAELPRMPATGSAAMVAPPSAPASVPGLTDGPTFASSAPASAAYALPNVQVNAGTLVAPGTAPTKPVAKKRRKKKKSLAKRIRKIVSRIITTAILLGILGGGAFAVKKYVIDRAKWTTETEAIADTIETTTGATFDRPVAVTELPSVDFAARRADVALGVGDAVTTSATWQAVGVIAEPLDLAAIGGQPSLTGFAFYDPAADEVFVHADASPRLRESSLRHALTVALTYQSTSGEADNRSTATARWLHADAVADAVSLALGAADDPTVQDARNVELLEAVGAAPTTPLAPYVQALLGEGPSLPVVGALGAAADNMPANDVELLNPFGPQVVTSADSMGALFWYHALAGRIDDANAWAAIATLGSDVTTVTADGGRTCVEGSLSAPDGLEPLTAAFMEWAALAPAGSDASTAVRGTVLAVRSCQPPGAAATAPDTGDLFGAAPIERQALATLVQSDATASATRQRCVVTTMRSTGAAADAAIAACPA